jgi:nitrite reductase/ring-hydroxylating ferredoxin subunit
LCLGRSEGYGSDTKVKMMKWTEVLEEIRLSEEAREVVEVEGESLLLIRHRGEVYAVAVGCPHMGAQRQEHALPVLPVKVEAGRVCVEV